MQLGGAKINIPVISLICTALLLVLVFAFTTWFDNENNAQPEGLVINILDDGMINIGNQEMSLASLKQVLLCAKQEFPVFDKEMTVFIRCGKNVPYKPLGEVVATLQQAGLCNIRLTMILQKNTQPEKGTP